MNIIVRKAEPEDYLSCKPSMLCQKCTQAPLQLPLPSKEHVEKAFEYLSRSRSFFVAEADGNVVGFRGWICSRMYVGGTSHSCGFRSTMTGTIRDWREVNAQHVGCRRPVAGHSSAGTHRFC